MKKRFLSILITVCMILTMLPATVFAAEVESFGDFSVGVTNGSPSSVASYDNSTKVLKVTGDCTIANTDPSTSTNDTISIESNCTVTLAGVNIKALAPTSSTDLSEPNPININGAYTVTINLEAGKSNILDFTESSTPDANYLNIRRGSGKAGLHVPSGATLTINGVGILYSTGAEGFNISDSNAHGGGGAGIGGDGSPTDGQITEASGTVIIKSGTVIATGGNAAGNWGGGGAGIGGGGGVYNKLGGNSGKITIEGGLVTACGGNSGVASSTTAGSGIGAGGGGRTGDATADEVTLCGGAVVQATGGNYGVQGNRITISGDSTRLNAQGKVHALSIEPITSDSGKIVSAAGGTWEGQNVMVTFQTAPDPNDPDVAILDAAKTAAENTTYNDMTQAAATDETAIQTVLKSTAETAVNDSSVAVDVNYVAYTLPVAGTSSNPQGTDGSYTFTITVSKGLQSLTTSQKTITITATAYTGITDVQAVSAAKAVLVDGSVEVAFGASQTDKTAAVQSYVDSRLSAAADAAGVTAVVTYNSATGSYDVALLKGSEHDSKSLTMMVNVAPDPDIAIVAAAKAAAQDASYSNMTQAAAADEAAIQTALKSTAETAVNDSSVAVDVNYVAYTLPVAGTSSNPQGTDGSYTFTITVSKGLQSLTTSQKTIIITATAYTGVTDVQAVSAAKAALVNGSVEVAFGASQTDKTAAVQSYVDSQLSAAADAAGVTAVVTYNNVTGSYDVALSKGSEHDSKSLTMTVNVAPDPDIAIVAAAKAEAQDASYSNMTQAAAVDEAAIQTALKSTAETAVNNSSVTVSVTKVSFTASVAGTSSNPQGTDGSYTFTITVSKGLQNLTTSQKTITITATAYTGVTDVQAVSAAKAALVNGSVEVAFGASQTDKTAAVQSYVDSRLSAADDAAGVTAVVTYNNATGSYDVALSKGSEHDSKSLTMTVNVAPDPDIAIVAAAKAEAQDASYSNMTQVAAVDEAAIQTALKSTAETVVNNSNVTVSVTKVSFTASVAGTSSNPQGTDGSYTFTITVSKGLQSLTTSQKTITITATAYTGISDVQAVSAAKTVLVDGSVDVAFGASQTDKTAAVQSYVDSRLSTAADAAGVTAVVTYNSATGSYDVALLKGSEHDSKSLTVTVNVAPDPDIAIVAAAKAAAQDASYSNMSQAAATDEAAMKAALKSTAVAAVNDNNVIVTINKVSYTAPVSGTSADLDGTNGSYAFTITVSKGTQSQTTIQKTITITATAYTGNNNSGSAGGSSGNIGNNSSSDNGKIVKNEQQDSGAPATSLNNSTEDLKMQVFTKDELSKIAAGENAKVILKVTDISASVREDDKKLITENLKGDTSVVYIDLSLYKQIGNGEAEKVTNTNGMISVSFEVPEYLWNTDLTKNRTYKIVRVHDGVAAVIEGTYDPVTHLFTFETDKFSTYALAYEDTTLNEVPVSGNVSPFFLTTISDKLSQTLTYTKVSGADGYFIYGAKCGSKYKLKKLADVTGNIKSYCHKNLKEATYYKYQVKAYRVINGQKVVIASSNITHSITTGSSFANPVKVTTKISAVTIAVGESKVVTFKAVLPKGKKIKNHTAAIRYKTTNAAIITVSKDGMIKAKSKGSCYVYAYAQNGVYLKIKVTVK